MVWRLHLNRQGPNSQEVLLRKIALLAVVCALLWLAHPASAQQADAMIGFGTIMSPSAAACNGNSGCPETGGLYPSISADVIFHRRLGFAYEVSWRGGQGKYPLVQIPYRPIINDFNVDFQPKLSKKLGLDILGGIGLQSTRVYSSDYSCSYVSCTNYTSSDHFLTHIGGGLRYYFWHHVFVRPEIHYYWINNNTNDFSSNNVLRVGGSIGYTIGPE
jgi:hypothetical protein